MTTTIAPSETEITRRPGVPEMIGWTTLLNQLFDGTTSPVSRRFPLGEHFEEQDDAFILEIDLPGVRKEDITIEVAGRRVSVTGSRTEKACTGIVRSSTRTTGTFAYEFTLPGPIDIIGVVASLTDGVLTIRLPKATESRGTHIAID